MYLDTPERPPVATKFVSASRAKGWSRSPLVKQKLCSSPGTSHELAGKKTRPGKCG